MSARRRSSAAPSLFAEPKPAAPPVAAPARSVVFPPFVREPAEPVRSIEDYFDRGVYVLDFGDRTLGPFEPDRDGAEARVQRSHERATTPSPALLAALRNVCPVTGMRKS